MRDWMADWRKWSRAERTFAVVLFVSMIMALPLGLLFGLARPGI